MLLFYWVNSFLKLLSGNKYFRTFPPNFAGLRFIANATYPMLSLRLHVNQMINIRIICCIFVTDNITKAQYKIPTIVSYFNLLAGVPSSSNVYTSHNISLGYSLWNVTASQQIIIYCGTCQLESPKYY